MARRSARARRRRVAWLGGGLGLVVLVLLATLTGPGRPPSSRPLGAGLPPGALVAPSMPAMPTASRTDPQIAARLAEEEERLASLRRERAALEAQVAALRQEAEDRRRGVPARKDAPDDEAAAGATQPPLAAAGGGPGRADATATAEREEPGLRIFVHHRANSRPGATAAAEVAETLRGAGLPVAEVRTAPFVPSTPVVRYFHAEDQAAAARLAGRLGRGWAIQDFRAFEPQPAPHTLEIWLPAS